MLKQLIYASQAVNPMSDEDLIKLLKLSRERNNKHHITGMLVYKNSVFLQVLEGEEGELEAIWRSIKADPRHENIVQISFAPVAERDFSDWSMGFVNMAHVDLASMPGYSNFLEEDFSPEGLCAKPGRALDFLMDVKYCDLP